METYKTLTFSLLSLMALFLFSCENNSGRSYSKQVGNYHFKVNYEPSSMKREAKNEMEYFKLELDLSNDLDLVEYLSNTTEMPKEDVLYYLSYRLKDDIYLLVGSEKKENVLYHFERSFDLKKSRVFNIGFEPFDDTSDEEITLLIDSELLNIGIVKMKI